jgi:O-acetyl-ADP-ribose deacetylase (regulator of RNase III)
VSVGTAVATSAGALQANHIIHVVTPIWTGGGNSEKTRLEKCITNAYL